MRNVKWRQAAGMLAAVVSLSLACPADAVAQMGGGGMGPPGGGKGGPPPGGPPPGGGPRRGGPPGKAKGDEFNPAAFSCFDYTSGLGETSTNRLRSIIARVWIQGNLTGLHRANGDLAFSDNAADRAALTDQLDASCRAFPTASILTAGVIALSKQPLKMPDEIFGGVKVNDYTCEAHLAAKSGGAGDAIKSDIAEMWSFAFIQGYKLAKAPDVVVPMEAKPLLVNAVLKACSSSRTSSLLDVTALVAERVKLQ